MITYNRRYIMSKNLEDCCRNFVSNESIDNLNKLNLLDDTNRNNFF